MKLHGTIDIHVKGERILRDPSFWDRMKQRFGGNPNLDTGNMRASLEAAALIDAIRRALKKLGATNAVSLVIDDQVLFQDLEGKPDDLGDLFLAFSDHESVFGAGFRLLRLAVEHEEAGLHTVIEVIARGEHPADEGAARIVIAGRVKDFEPRPGESGDAYRARVEPLTRNATVYEAHKRQFEGFVVKVSDAMRAAMPEARIRVGAADAAVVKPTNRPRGEQRQVAPTDRRYDPYDAYYPNPFGMMLSWMMWSSIFSMAMPPSVVVINEQGDHLGSAAEMPAEAAANPDVVDQGGAAADDYGGADTDGDGVADTDFGDAGGDFGGDFGDW